MHHPLNESSGRPTYCIRGLSELASRAFARPTVVVSLVEPERGRAIAATANARLIGFDLPDREGEGHASWATDAAGRLLEYGAALKPDDIVLVHCALGVSRSAAAALLLDIGWTIANEGLTAREAIPPAGARLISARSCALPNGSLLAAAGRQLDCEDALRAFRGHCIIRHSVNDY